MNNNQYIAALKQERDRAIQYREDKIAELKKGISHMLTLSRNGQEFPSHLDKLAKLLEQGE